MAEEINQEKIEAEEQGAVIRRDETPQPERMKIDLHCHTEHSWDCITPVEKILPRLVERQIRVQAITDHNEIAGAWEARELAREKYPQLTIIIGEEVMTSEGEIIGLFLKERIAPYQTAADTIAQIKAQGGLVLLPHGFDPVRQLRLKPDVRNRLRHQIDIIETYNGYVSSRRWNRAAAHYARQAGAYQSAGSDAHTLRDIGSAWVEVPYMRIETPQDLLQALEGGVPMGRWVHPALSLIYRWFTQLRFKVMDRIALRRSD